MTPCQPRVPAATTGHAGTRATILDLLREACGPVPTTALQEDTEIARSTLSYHLLRLEAAGLVRRRNATGNPIYRDACDPATPARHP